MINTNACWIVIVSSRCDQNVIMFPVVSVITIIRLLMTWKELNTSWTSFAILSHVVLTIPNFKIHYTWCISPIPCNLVASKHTTISFIVEPCPPMFGGDSKLVHFHFSLCCVTCNLTQLEDSISHLPCSAYKPMLCMLLQTSSSSHHHFGSLELVGITDVLCHHCCLKIWLLQF